MEKAEKVVEAMPATVAGTSGKAVVVTVGEMVGEVEVMAAMVVTLVAAVAVDGAHGKQGSSPGTVHLRLSRTHLQCSTATQAESRTNCSSCPTRYNNRSFHWCACGRRLLGRQMRLTSHQKTSSRPWASQL